MSSTPVTWAPAREEEHRRHRRRGERFCRIGPWLTAGRAGFPGDAAVSPLFIARSVGRHLKMSRPIAEEAQA